VFNVVRINDTWIQIEHHRWDSTERRFRRADLAAFARAGHEAAPVPRPSNAGQAS
jgi:hypothetical protein